jgi:WD40 repeat protein
LLRITASDDNIARFWDAHTGAPFGSLKLKSEIASAVFSPQDRRTATASGDGTACVWNNSPIPDPFAAACERIAAIR